MERNIKKYILKSNYFWLSFIILFQILFLISYMNNKVGFFIDENYTYGYANSKSPMPYGFILRNQDYSISNDIFNKWIDNKFFHLYLTAKNTDNYESIYNNHKYDLHPPLYSFILNKICSFYPGVFSPWYGFIINIFCFITVQILIFKISYVFFKSSIAFFPVLLYGYSLASINTYIYIRMYALVTVFFLLTTYLHLLYLKKQSKTILCYIFISNLLGFLTDYTLMVYQFFLSVFMCFYLKKMKNFKEMIIYGIIELIAVICIYFYFPIIFNSYLANKENINIFRFFSLSIGSIYAFIEIVLKQLIGCPELFVNELGNFFTIVVMLTLYVSIFIYLLSLFFKKKGNNKFSLLDILDYRFYVILFPILFYLYSMYYLTEFMVICKERYYFSIIPSVCIMIIFGIYKLLDSKFNHKYLLSLMLFIITLSSQASFLNNTEEFTLSNIDQKNRVKLKQIIKDSNCIVFTLVDHFILNFSDLLINAKNVFPTRINDVDVKKLSIALNNLTMQTNGKILIILPHNYVLNYYKPMLDNKQIINYIEKNTNYKYIFLFTAKNSFLLYDVFQLTLKSDI